MKQFLRVSFPRLPYKQIISIPLHIICKKRRYYLLLRKPLNKPCFTFFSSRAQSTYRADKSTTSVSPWQGCTKHCAVALLMSFVYFHSCWKTVFKLYTDRFIKQMLVTRWTSNCACSHIPSLWKLRQGHNHIKNED